jgi:DnaJ-class molecular chaperone
MADKPNPEEVPPGTKGAGENLCRACSGSGRIDGRPCPECEGTGKVTTPIGGA